MENYISDELKIIYIKINNKRLEKLFSVDLHDKVNITVCHITDLGLKTTQLDYDLPHGGGLLHYCKIIKNEHKK